MAGHRAAEINFWCPLVAEVSGCSALWLESSPGRGDFRPRALRLGQCLRFNGNLCRHHTQPTLHTDTTRVSFDLRVFALGIAAAGPGP